jgi:hypothetical protein
LKLKLGREIVQAETIGRSLAPFIYLFVRGPATSDNRWGRLLPVIRCLYEAATGADKWLAFWKEPASCFKVKGAQILRFHPAERNLSFSALYGYGGLHLCSQILFFRLARRKQSDRYY